MRFIKRCTIYISSQTVLVATNYFNGNFYVELEGGVYDAPHAEPLLISKIVKKAMAECQFNDGIDISGKKKSDWPAFKTSGTKSMRDFERDYRRHGMAGLNEHNVTWGLESPSLPNEISMTKNVLPQDEDQKLGEAIIEFDRFYCAIRHSMF
jgi:hypothetical protein